MHNRFVKTSNVSRFLAAIDAVEDRGAPEASICLVGGDAGYGKSRCGFWWALHNDAVFLRIKAAATPHWVLTDLVRELGEQAPAHTCEKLYGQAVGYLMKHARPIVVDEVEQAVKNDLRALEILRDISDFCEIPLILIGREYVRGKLKRHRQLHTRISGYVEFGPATAEDVRLCVEELCEVPVAEDVVARIHDESEGHIREIVKAIANVERVGKKRKGETVTLDLLEGRPICQDWTRPRARGKAA